MTSGVLLSGGQTKGVPRISAKVAYTRDAGKRCNRFHKIGEGISENKAEIYRCWLARCQPICIVNILTRLTDCTGLEHEGYTRDL